MANNIYISSDGTKKNISEMNFEYLVNALAKSCRTIFESNNVEEYNSKLSTIQMLEREIDERFVKFLASKFDEDGWF